MNSAAHPQPADKLGGAPHSKSSLRLWLRLLSCTLIVEKRIRQRLKDEFGTTLPRFDVMSALNRSADGLTMSQLSQQIMVSNGNVTGVVSRLIEDGLVLGKTLASDRRVMRVTLTRKGREQFQRMAAVHERWIDQTFSDLSDCEIAELMDRLAAMRRSIDKNTL
jgi:DNA-binding MarR family transcriptional regulator